MSKTLKDNRYNIGRLGPATNLRPAGTHKQSRDGSRTKVRQALRKGDWD